MPRDIVVVDTNVFSAALAPDRGDLLALYEDEIVGRKIAISFQTAAEMRFGALNGGWGVQRMEVLEARIAGAITVPPTDDLTSEFAALRYECRQVGHPLHQKAHGTDLWIAATARLLAVPLIAHDQIFRDAPGLEVICHA